MKTLYCWRCKLDVPMLDEVEYETAKVFYSEGLQNTKAKSIQERFKKLLDFYNELTAFGETEPNAIMHHRISQYGLACEICGKPYRTPLAKVCAACGNTKIND